MAAFPNTRALLKKREKLETFIEEALACLDQLDGDPDFEDSDPTEESDPDEWTEYDEEAEPDELVLGWSEGESLAGQLGCGQDWNEPTGDEHDGSFAEDEPTSYGKSLDYREGIAIREMIDAQLALVQHQKAAQDLHCRLTT